MATTAERIAQKQWPDDFPAGLPYNLTNKFDALIQGLEVDHGLEPEDANQLASATWEDLDMDSWPEPPGRLLPKSRGGEL